MTKLVPALIAQSDIETELAKVQGYGLYMFSQTRVGNMPAVNFLMLRRNPASDGVQEIARIRSVGWQDGEPVFVNSQVAEAFRAAELHPSAAFSERFLREAGPPDNPLEEEPGVDPVETPIEDPSEAEIDQLIADLTDPLPPERTGDGT